MSNIYILSDGGTLSREDEHLSYMTRDCRKTRILPFKTEHFVLVGTVNVTGNALRMIMKHQIPVLYMGKNGSYCARMVYQDGKNVFLRQKQYALLSDKKRSLEIAKSIVIGKIKNQLSFMQRIKRSRGNKSDFETAVRNVKASLKDAEKCTKVESLRGIEGNAAKNYFSAFDCNLIPAWAQFEKRTRNPPETNVNAVLSFLYTLLANYVTSAIEGEGLDTMAACMHTLSYGRDVLAFDLMEEFRIPIADTLTCHLFNKKILDEKDFASQKYSSESSGLPSFVIPPFVMEEENADAGREVQTVYLNSDGIKKVVAAFEVKMASCVIYAPKKTKLPFAEIIIEQAKMYRRVVLEEEEAYVPFYYR